jgi:CxxC motif-containing protein
MRNKHDFVCINCPLSCSLRLIEEDGKVLEIKGADCRIGEKYAVGEFKDPTRVVTTTVYTSGATLPLLPVRSEEPISKNMVTEVVRELAAVVVEAPVEEGQVVYENILQTGVDIVASRRLEQSGEGLPE